MTLRKALRGCGLLAAVFLALLVLYRALPAGFGSWLAPDRVAVPPVHGVLLSDEPILFELRRFRDDPSVKAVVLAIDSPGGAVAPSQSLYAEARKLRATRGSPSSPPSARTAPAAVNTSRSPRTASSLPGSVTGSIGVIMEFPDASELLGKVGVSMEVVNSSEHKDIGSPFRRASEGDRRLLQAMVSDVYEQFVAVVRPGRALPEDSVRTLADGRLLSGRQALQAGLVDRSGNLGSKRSPSPAGWPAWATIRPSSVRPSPGARCSSSRSACARSGSPRGSVQGPSSSRDHACAT